ncbi:hypothetical protein HD806DRAFT_509625 [Xylariaceae sp. AK1471]|nr:hypothetical protein HD806DRAFT_509625 [Xylariaceae sp. AK1471]
MQISNLFLTSVLLSLGSASIIPAVRGSASTTTSFLHAYARRAPAGTDINAVLEPQNFAKVQTDRRKAFHETL